MQHKILDFEEIKYKNNDKYSFLSQYISILQSKYIMNDKGQYKNLVNYSQNYNEPYHNWFKYKEGYAAELVKSLLEEFNYNEGDIVLDPFCGSGTTLLEGKLLGLSSVGFDVNPVSAFIAKSKLCEYTEDDIEKIKAIIDNFKIDQSTITQLVPKLSILDKIFMPNQLNDILCLKGFIETHENGNIFYILKTAYLSIIESVSNMKKDGNGIKYLKNPKPLDVKSAFIEKVTSIINDIEENRHSFKQVNFSEVINDTFLNAFNYKIMKEGTFDHIVFSPPYANCFDYCAVYKMELWLGGFINDYPDFKNLRRKAIRSHVNGSVNPNLKNQYVIIDWISEQLKEFDLWDKKIPKMIQGYFDDMTEVLKICYRLLKDKGNCATVVANSSYKEFVVPTDLFLADIAAEIGFTVKEINVCRPLRTSSQQMNMPDDMKNYLRESIIILEK